jgi:hypothetical protein
MGNVNSLSRADTEQAATNTNWKEESEGFAGLKKAKTSRRTSTTKGVSRNIEGPLHTRIDDIYDLVMSLKQEGAEGQELLEEFVARQTKLLESEVSTPPMTCVNIPVDGSNTLSTGKTRARAA